MASILDRIDNSIAGECCPCGAEPRPGSPYCSADCEPTHHGRDTTAHRDGTAMRWRPDLVTAHDDSNLDLICADVPVGRHTGTMYRRGNDAVHLRVDDGHRWVGCDIPEAEANSVRIQAAWAALERELGNRRHLADDITAGALTAYRQAAAEFGRMLDSRVLVPAPASGVFIAPVGADPADAPAWTPLGTTAWSERDADIAGDVRAFLANDSYLRPRHFEFVLSEADLQRLGAAFEHAGTLSRQLADAVAPIAEGVQRLREQFEVAGPDPEHPLARMNARRHNASHGPQRDQRPPRQLGPRGR